MIPITCVEDMEALRGDPALHREVLAYLCACRDECEEKDDFDVDFAVLGEEDLPMLAGLGEPEELARIEIHTGGQVRVITRLVFVATVYFVTGDLKVV